MSYPIFDRSRLRLGRLEDREHLVPLAALLPLDAPVVESVPPDLDAVAARILAARGRGAPVVVMMGAHVIKSGLSRYLIDLMERGLITHLGMNGAGPIHDFELALVGGTSESVARHIRTGAFGLWEETGHLNDAARWAAANETGFGEAIGRMIVEEKLPHADASVLAAGYRLQVPITVHVGIGYDILHEFPNADGAAIGAASYRDFLVLARAVEGLEGGVLLNLGTAVMGPEVFLKALSMARNVAAQEGRSLAKFTTAVFDLHEIRDWRAEPAPTEALYYYRPLKTLLVRTVADGGESFYLQGAHRETIPALRKLLLAG